MVTEVLYNQLFFFGGYHGIIYIFHYVSICVLSKQSNVVKWGIISSLKQIRKGETAWIFGFN